MSRIRKLAMVMALLSATASAQRTRVVALNGSGDFTSLQGAANASSPGDTIIVRSGQYAEPNATVITKGVTILCDPGVLWAWFAAPPIYIENIPADQTLTWRGGSFSSSSGITPSMVVRGCEGHVLINGFQATNFIKISGCRNVYLHRISLEFDGIFVQTSTVTMTNCSFDVRYVHGEIPIELRSSRVAIANSLIISRAVPFGVPALSPAIKAVSSVLTIGARTRVGVIGGTQPAITTKGTVLIELDPSAVLVSQTTPMIQGTAQVVDVARSVVRASFAAVGEVFEMTAFTEPDSLIATFVEHRFQSPVPTPFGDLWVRPIARVIDFGRADANGKRSFSVVVPPIAPGFPIVLQPIALSVSGALTLGVASGIVMN